MAKDNKKFYDSYDELFEKQNTKKNVQKKIFSDKKTKSNQSQNAQNENKRQTKKKKKKKDDSATVYVIIGVAVVVFFGYKLLGSGTDIFPSSSSDREYGDVTPLPDAGIKKAEAENIDVGNPLVVVREDRLLKTNRSCEFEIQDKTEINSQTLNKWSVLPTTKTYGDTVPVLSIQLYEDGRSTDSIDVKIASNLINETNTYVDRKAIVKAFPLKAVDDVQTGYIFEANPDRSSSRVKKYFLFKDGTGLILDTYEYKEDKVEVNKLKTLVDFKKEFKKSIDNLENSVKFKPVDDKLNDEKEFEVQTSEVKKEVKN